MKVLAINAGSSSLKYQLIDYDTKAVMAKGLCERIGIDGRLVHRVGDDGDKLEFDIAMPTHKGPSRRCSTRSRAPSTA